MSSTNNDGNGQKPWRFVTNHTQVLLAIASDPDIRTREIAEVVGITERAAQRIVADLVESGHVESTRVGRRSHYTIHRDVLMRHPAQFDMEIGVLIDLLKPDDE
jgi:predicted HTH transcriptional regulator